MGINRYLSKLTRFGKHIYQKPEECHVGRDNCVNLRALCIYFEEILECMKENEEAENYQEFLTEVRETLEVMDSYRGHVIVKCAHHPEIFEAKYDNLPEKIMGIYDFLVKEGMEFDPRDEYDHPYDFREFITVYCVNEEQKEFGGLRYSTGKDFS